MCRTWLCSGAFQKATLILLGIILPTCFAMSVCEWEWSHKRLLSMVRAPKICCTGAAVLHHFPWGGQIQEKRVEQSLLQHLMKSRGGRLTFRSALETEKMAVTNCRAHSFKEALPPQSCKSWTTRKFWHRSAHVFTKIVNTSRGVWHCVKSLHWIRNCSVSNIMESHRWGCRSTRVVQSFAIAGGTKARRRRQKPEDHNEDKLLAPVFNRSSRHPEGRGVLWAPSAVHAPPRLRQDGSRVYKAATIASVRIFRPAARFDVSAWYLRSLHFPFWKSLSAKMPQNHKMNPKPKSEGHVN